MTTGSVSITPEGGTSVNIGGGLEPFDGTDVAIHDKGGAAHDVATYAGATDAAKLAAASAAAIGAGGGPILLSPGIAATITADATVGDATCSIDVRPGAMVTVETGQTLTIATRNVRAERVQWITLQGTGKVLFAGGTVVMPEWWGATVGSTVQADMDATYDAFRAAYACFDSKGGTIDLAGDATYYVGKKDANGYWVECTEPHVTLRGQGRSTVLKLKNALISASSDVDVFRVNSNVAGLRWERFMCDGNGTNNLQPATGAQLQQQWFTIVNGDYAHIDVWVRNHAGSRVVGVGDASNEPVGVTVKIRAETVADAVTGNSNLTDHTTVWMRGAAEEADVDVRNSTMASIATALELHGSVGRGRVRATNVRYAYLPVALLADSVGGYIESIVCESVKCAVGPYALSTYRMQQRIESVVGTQAGEDFAWVDFVNVTDTAADSELSFGRIECRNLEASPADDKAFLLRLGQWNGRISVDSMYGSNMPCGLIGNTTMGADEAELIVGHATAVDCGRTSSSTVGTDYAISLTGSAKIRRFSIGKTVLRNTAGGSSPMVGWLYLTAPFGDLDIGHIDAGTVPPLFTTGGSYAVDRTPGYRIPITGSLGNGGEQDIEVTTKCGLIRIVAAGATKNVAALLRIGATAAASPTIMLADPSGDVANSDSLGDLCVFWNSGKIRIKNNLGETVSYMASVEFV